MFVNIFIYACIYTLTEHLTRTVAKYNMVSAPGWCPIKISVGVLKAETVEKGFWALIGRLFLGWQDMDCTWFVRNNLQVLPSSAWWFFPTKIFTFHMFAVNKRGSDLRVEPFWFGFFDHFMMHCSTGSAALCVCVWCSVVVIPSEATQKTLHGIHVSYIFHWEGYFDPG